MSEKKDDKPSSTDLAILRTSLANERTFLAFLRTGLAVTAFGLKAAENKWITVLGLIFIAAGFFQYQGIKDPSVHKNKYLNLTSLTIELTIIGMIFLVWYSL